MHIEAEESQKGRRGISDGLSRFRSSIPVLEPGQDSSRILKEVGLTITDYRVSLGIALHKPGGGCVVVF